MKQYGKLDLRNMDCMDLLRDAPDNAWDLAIVDPPYGIDVANMNMGVGKGKRCSNPNNRKWSAKDWDVAPCGAFFDSLFRVSLNQIIWGGNYFSLPPSQYFAVWDKGEGMRGRSFAEGEFAWVRSGGTRIHRLSPVDKHRIHPTQKPVALYRWLLQNYAKPGDTILDTHGGSMSIAIACGEKKHDLTLCELDEDYFKAGVDRVQGYFCQMDMFYDQPRLIINGEEV